MKFIDLFAGIGGFRIAMERAGHECVLSCDIDRWCDYVWRKRFGKGFEERDIRKINTADLPDFDVICGGFPCQDLSLAGKRAGLEGGRSGLFYEIIRLAEAKRPKYIFLENVKGLLSSNGGWDFYRVLSALDEHGYDVEWAVLNSSEVIPQNRERIFIIGHIRGESSQKIFPIREDSGEIQKLQKEEVRIYDRKGFGSRTKGFKESVGITPTLSTKMGTGGNNVPMVESEGRLRRLTPKECERLQTFPDDWTANGISGDKEINIADCHRYQMIGNAITVDVVYQIAKRL